MTRIIQCGFESGDTAQEGADSTGSGTLASNVLIVTATPSPRNGTYSLKCITNSVSGQSYARKRIAHATLTDLWYAFGFQFHHISEPAATSGMFRTVDSAGNANLVLINDAGIIRAYYYTVAGLGVGTSNITLIGSASASISADAWHLIEIHHIPHLSAGTVEIYIDGTQVLSATGTRTANTNANNSDFILEFQRYGASTGNAGSYHAFDDVRVNSTAGSVNNGKPGDGKIIGLIPTGAGNYTQLTPSVGSNFQCVDETPPNTTDYVSHSTVGNKDTYAMSDLALTGIIQSVQQIAYAENSDGGGGSIGFLVRSGGVDNEATAQNITSSWTYYKRIMEIDPTDSAAWTTAKVNALEAGMVVR